MRIQYLRGIAAMMVVLHHVLQSRPLADLDLHEIEFGRPGVLIFFVLSGFVMFYACRSEGVTVFVYRRIVRVVPLYWIMTAAMAAILVRYDLGSGRGFHRVDEIIKSFLFIPHYSAANPEKIWPVLVPGWTLNYEMFFFAIFAFGLALRHVFRLSIAILLALVVAGLMLDSDDAIIRTYTNPFLLLFVAGILLGRLFQDGRIYSGFAWFLVPGVALVVLGAVRPETARWQEPAFFAAAICIVAGVLGLECRGREASNTVLATIGDASYSIYLSHLVFMVFLMAVLAELSVEGLLQLALFVIGSTLACVAFGILVWRYVETPLLRYGLRRPVLSAEKPTV